MTLQPLSFPCPCLQSGEQRPRFAGSRAACHDHVSECNGMNAEFEEKIHCIAAEPHATFLHVGVANQGHKVAYETAVLGRLQSGYRVFALRGRLGTRIELACLFVHISSSRLPHLWASSRQVCAACMRSACTRTLTGLLPDVLAARSCARSTLTGRRPSRRSTRQSHPTSKRLQSFGKRMPSLSTRILR